MICPLGVMTGQKVSTEKRKLSKRTTAKKSCSLIIRKFARSAATGISAYRIANCRRWYVFRYENGELFTDKYAMGWRKVKTLEGIPASVMADVKAICGR